MQGLDWPYQRPLYVAIQVSLLAMGAFWSYAFRSLVFLWRWVSAMVAIICTQRASLLYALCTEHLCLSDFRWPAPAPYKRFSLSCFMFCKSDCRWHASHIVASDLRWHAPARSDCRWLVVRKSDCRSHSVVFVGMHLNEAIFAGMCFIKASVASM